MSKLSDKEKEELRKKYNLKTKKCEECGNDGASLRWYNQRTLCNKCSLPLFKIFLEGLALVVISLVIKYLFF